MCFSCSFVADEPQATKGKYGLDKQGDETKGMNVNNKRSIAIIRNKTRHVSSMHQ